MAGMNINGFGADYSSLIKKAQEKVDVTKADVAEKTQVMDAAKKNAIDKAKVSADKASTIKTQAQDLNNQIRNKTQQALQAAANKAKAQQAQQAQQQSAGSNANDKKDDDVIDADFQAK